MWYCNVICLQVGADAYEQAGSGGSGPGFDGSGFGFPFSDIWSEVTIEETFCSPLWFHH